MNQGKKGIWNRAVYCTSVRVFHIVNYNYAGKLLPVHPLALEKINLFAKNPPPPAPKDWDSRGNYLGIIIHKDQVLGPLLLVKKNLGLCQIMEIQRKFVWHCLFHGLVSTYIRTSLRLGCSTKITYNQAVLGENS